MYDRYGGTSTRSRHDLCEVGVSNLLLVVFTSNWSCVILRRTARRFLEVLYFVWRYLQGCLLGSRLRSDWNVRAALAGQLSSEAVRRTVCFFDAKTQLIFYLTAWGCQGFSSPPGIDKVEGLNV